jgi:ferredoxin--NADP+ reductase
MASRCMRAYCVVSAHYEEHLEFLSIKVPNGPLTSRLQHLQVGDTILVSRKKPTGSLLMDYLLPGKRLYFALHGHWPGAVHERDPRPGHSYEAFEEGRAHSTACAR